MSLRILEFDQPDEQLTLNDRHHRIKNAKIVKAWRERVYWAACQERATPSARRVKGHAQVQVIFPVTTHTRRDPHNWMPTVKAIIDGLTDANLWPDDNSDHVTVLDSAFYHVERSDRRRIIYVHITTREPS